MPGEVTGAEHRHWPETNAILAQVRTGQRRALRQRPVDACTVEIATTQDLGEQTHLAAGTTALALDPCRRQRGFTADHGHERIAQGVQLIGNGLEELGPAHRTQAAVGWISRRRGLGGGVDFFCRGLDEVMGQGLAGAGVDALQASLAGCAARPPM